MQQAPLAATVATPPSRVRPVRRCLVGLGGRGREGGKRRAGPRPDMGLCAGCAKGGGGVADEGDAEDAAGVVEGGAGVEARHEHVPCPAKPAPGHAHARVMSESCPSHVRVMSESCPSHFFFMPCQVPSQVPSHFTSRVQSHVPRSLTGDVEGT